MLNERVGVPFALLLVWGPLGMGWYVFWFRRQPQDARQRMRTPSSPNSRGRAAAAIFVGLGTVAAAAAAPRGASDAVKPLWVWIATVLTMTALGARGTWWLVRWGRRSFGSLWPDVGNDPEVLASVPSLRRRTLYAYGTLVVMGSIAAGAAVGRWL